MKSSQLVAGALLAFMSTLSLTSVMAAPTHIVAAHVTARAIFAGTNGKIYQSTDGGQTWQETDNGLADGAVYPLTAGAGATVYAAPGSYGVYNSTDGGRTWQDDNGVNGPIGAAIYGLAVDPGDGERVYALDDSGNFYRSSDSGGHWSMSVAPLTQFDNSSADALQVDALRPSTMLINSDTGMALSTDAGISWSIVDSIPQGVGVFQAAFSGANPNVAYAATQDGIYQTIDGGLTWQQENRGIPAGTSLVVIGVDPDHASHIIAYSDAGDIYRSIDGGTTWTLVEQTGATVKSLAFDPTHSGTVLAGTDDGVLFRSTDDGRSWQQSDPSFGVTPIESLAAAVRQALPTDSVNPPVPGTTGVYYSSATHHLISGAFLRFYNQDGGLRIFGLPLTEAFQEKGHTVQYFERAELVLQKGQVTLAPLGAMTASMRDFPPVAPIKYSTTRLYFAETQHTLSGKFLTFWRTHHGSQVVGQPVSEPVYETNGDGTGRVYLVQYFQNLRLEYHPELSGTSNEVTVGQLGREQLQRRGWL